MTAPTLYLASSALQAEPLLSAIETLWPLMEEAIDAGWIAPDSGFQLCPGNREPGDALVTLVQMGVPYRYHHSFSWAQPIGANLWPTDDGVLPAPVVRTNSPEAWSFHPPNAPRVVKAIQTDHVVAKAWMDAYEADGLAGRMLEVMWGPYDLADDPRINEVMDRGIPLALDVSHAFIGLQQGRITKATWERLLAYPKMGEFHVSANDGKSDIHRALRDFDFGLKESREWALAEPGRVVVFESYFHRLSEMERLDQIRLASGS